MLNSNSVLCVKYYNNKYSVDYVYKAIRLEGAIQPADVLKPTDLNAAQSRNWRPQIGMAPATQRVTISDAGRRMLDFQGINRPHNNRNNGKFTIFFKDNLPVRKRHL